MSSVDLLYYLAGGFLILMAYSRTVFRMRLFNIASGGLFVTYGVVAEVWPVAILNGAMMLIHIYQLTRIPPTIAGHPLVNTRGVARPWAADDPQETA